MFTLRNFPGREKGGKEMRIPGIYETFWGNAAVVKSWESKVAWDLDMGEFVPIELVSDTFIRPIEQADEDDLY